MTTKQFVSSPKTQQGYASIFQLSNDGKWLGYITKNTVIIRDMDDLSNSKIFTKHTAEVCGFAFHPDGKTAASVDVTGNCFIFDVNTLKDKTQIEHLFGGKINGLQFNEDGSKLLVYGSTKSLYARVLNWEMKTDCGKIDGVTRELISGCFTNKKPNRLMVGSEDGEVHFYEGPPFKHKLKMKEHEGKFVSGIKCSPDGTKFVSVAFDKKIVTYDAKEGTQLEVLDTSKVANGHKMAIIGCAFIDDDRLVTASLDKSVKIWNLKEKTLLFTLIPKDDKKLKNDFCFCGVQVNSKKIVAVALSGIIYVWNLDSLADNKLPDEVWDGHQGPINCILYSKSTKEIISSDTTGKVLIFPETGAPKLLVKTEQPICKIALSQDESLVHVLVNNGTLLTFDKASLAQKSKVENLGSGMRGLVASRKNNDDVFVLFSKGCAIVSGGAAKKKGSFTYEAKALEVNEELGEFLIGDNKGVLHVLDMEFKEKGKFTIHLGEYSCIKLSPDNKMIASGNNQTQIKIYDAASKDITNDRFGYHSSKIFDLDWTSDSKFLISCSLDYTVMIWDIETKKRVKNYQSIDGAQQNSVKFVNDNKDFVCAGNNCTVHEVKFE